MYIQCKGMRSLYLKDAVSHSEMYSQSHSALKACAYDLLLIVLCK